jgi:hypothetical protein
VESRFVLRRVDSRRVGCRFVDAGDAELADAGASRVGGQPYACAHVEPAGIRQLSGYQDRRKWIRYVKRLRDYDGAGRHREGDDQRETRHRRIIVRRRG